MILPLADFLLTAGTISPSRSPPFLAEHGHEVIYPKLPEKDCKRADRVPVPSLAGAEVLGLNSVDYPTPAQPLTGKARCGMRPRKALRNPT